ncbi:MAG: alanine--tRNA ligase-related protein [bacterium]|nr:alanine--tRNA ligase-related protein [bacterium]
MTAAQLREKYLKFFEKQGHKIIPSYPLVPDESQQLEGKEKVLFTSAGMQPLIPYLSGKKEPPSRRLADCQKCLRTDDIEEVGDLVHHTFFEMLGNWSIGDLDSKGSAGTKGSYWKKEAIEFSFEFLTKELSIPIEKLAVSVFAGDKDAPRDEESAQVWQELGIPEKRIFYLGKEHNWWPTAKREQDSGEFKEPFGPCGPDTEMFYWTGDSGPEGSVDADSRWVEIWNDVFMEYNRWEDGTLEKLPMQSVDTGMGLERALAVLNGKKSGYETDLFEKSIELIKANSKQYEESSARIIADHLRASLFLLAEGIVPTNTERGYVLRKLLRRAVRHLDFIKGKKSLVTDLVKDLVVVYESAYPELKEKQEVIHKEIQSEVERFNRAIEEGLANSKKLFEKKVPVTETKYSQVMKLPHRRELFRDFYAGNTGKTEKEFGLTKEEIQNATIEAKESFDLYQSFGFPIEMIVELAQAAKLFVDIEGFEDEFKKHQEVSRGVSAGEFKGGLADHSDLTVRGHTATHLLHQALRDVLGEQVHQTGSNITPERIRFDFSHGEKLTDEQIRKVEEIVNSKIKDDLQVKKELITPYEADKKGAIGLFKDKYGDKVSIYEIGGYSTEYCGGPHVEHTSQVGEFKIVKEEALGAGQRRIRAVLS